MAVDVPVRYGYKTERSAGEVPTRRATLDGTAANFRLLLRQLRDFGLGDHVTLFGLVGGIAAGRVVRHCCCAVV